MTVPDEFPGTLAALDRLMAAIAAMPDNPYAVEGGEFLVLTLALREAADSFVMTARREVQARRAT